MTREEKTISKATRKMSQTINNWGLKYTFGSMEYCLDIEGVSLEQCATCYFFGTNTDSDDDIIKSIEKATRILITAGLIDGSSRDYNVAKNKATEYMDEWRDNFGNIALLHATLISILKERDFFSESLTTALDVITGMKLLGMATAMTK